MKQPSVMPASHNFSRIPQQSIPRSKLDRSHGVKTTINAGYLYPFLVDEVLPGDTLSLQSTLFARFQTLLAPIMDNVYLDTFYFFVPNRLVWENWVRFMGEQDNPTDSIDYVIPKLMENEDASSVQFHSGDLGDYFGLPTEEVIKNGPTESPINALFFRAYNLIWNQWFRDQNFQNSASVPVDDGPDNYTLLYSLLRRGKRHDYPFSSLPSPQKGAQVTIPIGTLAPVIGNGLGLGINNNDAFNSFVLATGTGGSTTLNLGNVYDPPKVMGAAVTTVGSASNQALGVTSDPDRSGLVADLSSVAGIPIAELRTGVAVQQLLEMYARGGTRYVELIKAEYGVISPDFRLQRPEYLGGGSQPIDVSSVPQTSASTVDNKLGSLGAYGTSTARSGFSYNATEHGMLIGLCNIRADITYQQCIEKMWSRRTRYDFFHPVFQNLSEQAVLNQEVNYTTSGTGGAAYPTGVWGYQERYAEYRYKRSYVTGKMRSNTSGGSLDQWHLALDFEDAQVFLDADTIQDQPPIERVVAVTDEPQFYVDIFNRYVCIRPMGMYSIPGLTRF